MEFEILVTEAAGYNAMSEKRTLSAERIKELQNRPIDLSDIPEVSDSMWEAASKRRIKYDADSPILTAEQSSEFKTMRTTGNSSIR